MSSMMSMAATRAPVSRAGVKQGAVRRCAGSGKRALGGLTKRQQQQERGLSMMLRASDAEGAAAAEAAKASSEGLAEEGQTVEELIAEAEAPTSRAAAMAASTVVDPSGLFMGFDGTQGVFGFTPFAELFVGRAAMIGFASAMAVELATGGSGGALAQLGLMVDGEPNTGMATGIAGVALAATLIGTFQTFAKAQGRELSPAQVDGYRRFLNLREPEEVDAEEEAIRGMSEDVRNLIYARGIEIGNGRWAMIGFLWAIVAEAATGHGIIFQLVDYARMAGLLGEDSGF